jgi:site-specific DNA-cytosine methylase
MMRLVDIFSGCGGLSLGFDLYDGSTPFRTCLAIDNEPSATRLFNGNFSRLHPDVQSDIARTADVCWFESADEIRLFYLAHIARSEADYVLRSKLQQLGLGKLLSALRALDEECDAALRAIGASPGYSCATSQIEVATYGLASVKRLLKMLGVRSFNRPGIDPRALPWAEEAEDPFWQSDQALCIATGLKRDLSVGAKLWVELTEALRAGASKEGKGQHSGNAARYASLLGLLSGSAFGEQLQRTIVGWRSARAALIQTFAREAGPRIEEIYLRGYKVSGLLGGPPCKGFSRIGRPVAKSLRNQGVFAWASDEFGDERNKLVLHYVMFLEALRPSFFIFENVSNFQSTLETPDGILQADEVLSEAVANLSEGTLSYDVAANQLCADSFGVPQSRLRYIMFGIDRTISRTPAASFFDLARHPREVTVNEAFFGLPRPNEFAPGNEVGTATRIECSRVAPPSSDAALSAFFDWVQREIGGESGCADAHIYRRMRSDDAAFFRFMGPGIRWMDWELRSSPTLRALREALRGDRKLQAIAEGNLALRLILEETVGRFGLDEQHLLHASYLKNRSGTHGDWMERLAGDRPAKTVVAHIGKDTYGYLHPSEGRPITIREAARLQSFPDAFSFSAAGVVDAYSAIGNAVPPLLANVFARRVAEIMADGETSAVVDLAQQRRVRR